MRHASIVHKLRKCIHPGGDRCIWVTRRFMTAVGTGGGKEDATIYSRLIRATRLFRLGPRDDEGPDFCFVIPKRWFIRRRRYTGEARQPRAIIDGNHSISDRGGRGGRLITRKTDARPLYESSPTWEVSAYLFVGPDYVYTRITTAEVASSCHVKEKRFALPFRKGGDSRDKYCRSILSWILDQYLDN